MNVTEIVDKQLEFYNAGDMTGFLSTYTKDVELLNLEDNSIIAKGHDAMRVKYTERFDVQKVNATIQNRMVIGNKVIDYEHVTGIVKDGFVKAVAVYQISDGLISKVWFMRE